MGQYKQMSEEESLKRSHSKFSNFKLTLVCLLCAFALVVLVASVATLGMEIFSDGVIKAVIIVSGVLSAFSLFLISRFKR